MNMQQRVARWLAREPWWAEFWSACTTVLWASFSFAQMGQFHDWPAMKVLLQLGNCRFWQLLGFSLGLLQIIGLAGDRLWLRWGAALAQGWFWAALTVGVWAASPWSPAVPVHAGWCAINVLSALRMLRPGTSLCLRCP